MRSQTLLLAVLCAAPVTCQTGPTTTTASTSFRTTSICYDQARHRLTVFAPGSVWEWDGTRWGRLSVAAPSIASPVWSATERRIVAVSQNDIVAFDGHSFETLTTVPGPTGGARLVADTQSGELVVLTPAAINGASHQRWDGTSWRTFPPTPGQAAILSQGYDESRGVLVIEQIRVGGGVAFETLEWDGATWLLRETNSRFHGFVAYDYGQQRLIGTTSGVAYAWDGVTWTMLPRPSGQEPNVTRVTSGPPTGGIYGSITQQTNGESETWLRTQSAWTPIRVAHPLAIVPNLTFDSTRSRAVLRDATTHHEFDGNVWHKITATGPSDRYGSGQIYDAARQQTLVFGGSSVANPTELGDTWTWDGTAWNLASTSGPPPRRRATLAYDSNRQRVMLLGGNRLVNQTTQYFNDHWEWDGVSWALVNANVPMAAVGGSAGYDPVRDRTVFFSALGMTWEFDGQSWTAVSQDSLTTYDANLIWNGQSQQLQATLRSQSFVIGEYGWDGVQWRYLGQERGALAYDGNRDAFYQYTTSQLTITTPTPARAEAFAVSCGGQQISTTLTAYGLPRPGTTDLYLDLRAEAGLRPAFFVLGTGRTQLPLGHGCDFLIQNPIASVLSFTDALGVRQFSLPIRDDASLIGTEFTTQSLVLDPASAGGIAATQGMEFTLGN